MAGRAFGPWRRASCERHRKPAGANFDLRRETAARLRWKGGAFVHVGHGLRTFHIACLESFDPETCILDEAADGPIQVTAPADASPDRRETILPAAYPRVRRAAVLHKEQASARFQDAAHVP